MAIQRLSPGTIIVIVAIAGMFLTLTTAGLLSINQSVPTSGIVSTVNVGVYSDSACTQQLTSISWGSVAPGGTGTRTFYVKNTGTNQITLTMTRTTQLHKKLPASPLHQICNLKLRKVTKATKNHEFTKSTVSLVNLRWDLARDFGPLFLNAGLDYSGSYFPKDVKALIPYSNNLGLLLNSQKSSRT